MTCATRVATRETPLRWRALLFLLGGECAAFRIGFDIGTIGKAAGWWGGLMGEVTPLHQAAISAALAAVLLFLGRPSRKLTFVRILDAAHSDGRWRKWLAAHLASYCGVVVLAIVLRQRFVESAPVLVALQAIGFVLTTASLMFWLRSLAPTCTWRRLFVEERGHLLLACLVGWAAWGAGTLTQRLWPRHSGPTLFIVEQVLRWTFPQVISTPARQVIGVPGFLIRISPQCSGFEGLGLFCVLLATFCGIFFRRLRFPQAWLLLPIGIAGIWLGNTARIVGLVLIGKRWSHDVAIRGFHSETSWIYFHLLAIVLMVGTLTLRFFSRHR